MGLGSRFVTAWKALVGASDPGPVFPPGGVNLPQFAAGPVAPPAGQWLKQPVYPAYTPQWLGGQADWGQKVVSPALWGYLPGATRDFAREAGEVWNNATISICLNWLMDRFVEPCLTVVPDDGSNDLDPIEGHDLPKLLRRPNDHDDGDEFWQATLLSYICDGNAYWQKVRSGDGRVVALYWMPHWAVRARWPPGANVLVTYYEYLIRGQWWPLDPGDVVHFRNGKEPDNVRLGRSRLKALLRNVVGDNECDSYMSAIVKNMGISPVVFTPKDSGANMTPDDAKQIKRDYLAAAGGDNRGQPAFISGALEMHQVGLSPEQLALDKLQAIPAARLAAAIGTPLMAVGLPDSQRTYSNYKEAIDAAYQTLTAVHRRFGSVLSRDADFVDVGTECVRWDYTHVPAMQEDHNAKADRVVQLWTSDLMDRAEARGDLGLDVEPGMEGVFFSDLQQQKQQASAEHQAGLDADAAEHAATLEPDDAPSEDDA